MPDLRPHIGFPSVSGFEDLAKAGVLMSYGGRLSDDMKRLPYLIERIVNGAKPADIPVEQSTRFYLTINRQAAKAIGVVIPRVPLLQADAVVE